MSEKNIEVCFAYSDSNKRYHTYNYEMRRRYGEKCVKISLDAGFSCPRCGGCIYCYGGSSSADAQHSLARQFEDAAAVMRRKWGEDVLYIPYLQARTNTYAPPQVLRRVYGEVLSLAPRSRIAAMSIATRPDALGDPVMEVLRETAAEVPLTVELGLQSSNDETLVRIGRGHNSRCFEDAVYRLSEAGIEVCAHIINGLPGENEADMLETARSIARLPIGGVKIHMLNVLRGTRLCEMYDRGEIRLLDMPEYVGTVVKQLELLPARMYIGRICGDAPDGELVAPKWVRKKLSVQNEIDKLMSYTGTYQGILCK